MSGFIGSGPVGSLAIVDSIDNVSGLQTALAGKVDDSQVLTNVPASAVFTDTVYSKPLTEPISYVTGLQTALDDKYTEDDYIADEMVDMGWAR